MGTLFNYSCFKTELDRKTRTLHVVWSEDQPKFNSEMLFELESLLSWLITRVEINSVFFYSQQPFSASGIDRQQLSRQSPQQIEKWQTKLQKLIYAMMQLPQTIIFDLSYGARNTALELSLGADIRLAHKGTTLCFDHTLMGITPACGGLSFLPCLVGPTFAKNWIATGEIIPREQLVASGLIHTFYSEENYPEIKEKILETIAQQAPIQRIQSKMGLFEASREQLESQMVKERKISKASLISEDWKENSTHDYMPAKSLSYAVKLSLVKSEGWVEKDDQNSPQ